MTVRRLPRIMPFEGPEPDPNRADHPIRKLTREVAFHPETWTPERAAKVRDLFDSIAGDWESRNRPERFVPIAHALDRGGPFGDGLAVELGSGTGIGTPTISSRLPKVVAVDLSMEMLLLAPRDVPRIRADGAKLPFGDGEVATLILVNMLLFANEVDRVLETDGALVWVNTAGRDTPIHLTAEEIEAALPGEWDVIASEAGRGTWCIARRSAPSPG